MGPGLCSGVLSFDPRVLHILLLVKLHRFSLSSKSLVRITDCPDMTSAVYHGYQGRSQGFIIITHAQGKKPRKCRLEIQLLKETLTYLQDFCFAHVRMVRNRPGAGCSKLTMLLVKFSLKFKALIL